MTEFPQVMINLDYLEQNVRTVMGRCADAGVSVAGVVKGATGIAECIEVFAKGGATQIASSRLEQLETAKRLDTGLPLMLIRIPMMSEAADAVRLADISLNSEITVLRELDRQAGIAGKRHGVILMADLGDLREGFWDRTELIEAAVEVETNLQNLELKGVGTNLGCYGAIQPTTEKLDELVSIAEQVEKAVGRNLEIISGGATSSYMRILDGNLPERINHLRIGEQILNAYDLEKYYGYDLSDMHSDVFTLRAEVVEVKTKPTHPVGEVGVDAFGRRLTYEDRGIRRRAIVAVGKADIGDSDNIFPEDGGIEVLGGSSDHTILDVEDAERDIKPGDILNFAVNYGAMLYLTGSANVKIRFHKSAK